MGVQTYSSSRWCYNREIWISYFWNYLGSKKAVYMANIFGMPGIGRMFAMPKMKKYNHQIILADDEALITRFPQQTGKVTVLTLSDGKVSSIDYWAPGTEGIDVFLK